jgi:hypothetical protein
MAKRAVIQINTELLGKLLQLPEGLEVVHVAVGNHVTQAARRLDAVVDRRGDEGDPA